MNTPGSSTHKISVMEEATDLFRQQDNSDEASKRILGYWSNKDFPALANLLSENEIFIQHKSLILNLALQDYEQEKPVFGDTISLSDYCNRYSGLGETIENSIYHQLEVKKYLDENPDFINQADDFVWPFPGQEFLSFQVIEELGRGAIARAYLCKQSHLGNRTVVIKVELGHSCEPSMLGKLRHKNIMPILWADTDATSFVSYICMPFLGRVTLLDLIRICFSSGVPKSSSQVKEVLGSMSGDSNLTNNNSSSFNLDYRRNYIDAILQIALGIVDGLSHAHENQIIHGDIKPSNILLASDGSPLVFDFNLSREASEYEGPLGGTLSYMAPEQLQAVAEGGKALSSSSTSVDVYSFGVLLYELLAGVTPYSTPHSKCSNESSARYLIQQQRKGHTPLRDINSAVNKSLENLIASCLELEPNRRPSSMSEIHEHLLSETKTKAIVQRYAQVHPLRTKALFSGFVISFVLLMVYFVTRPPYAHRQFSYAMELKAQGDLKECVSAMDNAIEADPDFHMAKFERAQCFVSMERYSDARHELTSLLEDTRDANAMACLGYVFSKMGEIKPAIAWYKLALENGVELHEIHNNLGASLLLLNDRAAIHDNLSKSKEYLLQALELKEESSVIRMNLLRMAMIKHNLGMSFDEQFAIIQAKWLSARHAENPFVLKSIFNFFHSLADREHIDRASVLPFLKQAILCNGVSLQDVEEQNWASAYRKLPEYKGFVSEIQESVIKASSEFNRIPRYLSVEF